MPPLNPAFRAYARTQAVRSQREMEAEVFTIAAGRLRRAGASGTDFDCVRARNDAHRLSVALGTGVAHPSSGLPEPLRVSIVSVSLAAVREADRDDADLDFLARVCEDFAAGLSAPPPPATAP